MFTCAKCGAKGCAKLDLDKSLKDCPSKHTEIQEAALRAYEDEENHRIAYNSAYTEAHGYGTDTRLIEIMKFMHSCGYKRIGFAFCNGLKNEALEVTKILEYNGFEVVSVVCKNGATPKTWLGIEDKDTVRGHADREVMCNPVGQALALNASHTDFNIMMGLCVGHDTLFLKYLEGPVTVLAVKDRVTGHAPLAPIYCAQGYYKSKFYPEDPDAYKKG